MPETEHRKGSGEGILVGCLLLSVALIVSTFIATRAFIKVKGFGQTISVTGSASKAIRSNRAIWEGAVAVSATTLADAYQKLKADIVKTEAFLKEQGFESGQYEMGVVQVNKRQNQDGTIFGYFLRQPIKLPLDDVDRVAQLSTKASALLELGVEFYSERPHYLFTRLDDLKIEMIGAATANAKLRAEQLAETTGRKVGAPTSARVGVFQIRPLNSQEVSDMGMSDVSSIDKEIVSTVSVSFLIE